MGYIYLVTNLINQKKYVGQTLCLDIYTRWNYHKNKCKSSLGRCILAAYNKYGVKNFDFQIICVCFDEDCDKYEKEYIKKYDAMVPNGYNLREGGNNSKHNPETLKLISEKTKGKRNPPVTELTRKKLSESLKGEKNPNFGKKMSEEQKKKISESRKKMFEKMKDLGINTNYKDRIINPNSLANLEKGREKLKKKVAQYNLKGEFIASYESISEAAHAINGKHSTIGKVCDETKVSYKTYKRFIWKFVEV